MDTNQSAPPETTESKKSSRKTVIRVLATLGEMYPYSVIAKKLDGNDQRSFDLMVNAWQVALKPLSEEQVDHGLQLVLDAGERFEPSMPRFVQMCRGATGPAYDQYKSLPKPKSDKSVAVGEIIKMRGLLSRAR